MVFLTLFAVGCVAWLVFGELSGAFTPTVLVHSISGDFFTAALIIVVTAIMTRLLSEALLHSHQQLRQELRERKLAEERLEQDIALRLQAEEQIRRLNAELEQRVAERTAQLESANQELESFAYSVSHDLRAPLRAIDGYSRIVLDDYAGQVDPQAHYYLAKVREGTARMSQLIDALLEFSRLGRQALHRRVVTSPELLHLIRGIVDDLRAEHPVRAVEVTISELPACQVDPLLLKQVLVNLLDKACKYSRTRPITQIEIGDLAASDPTYYVRDKGVGFDMRYANKMFNVFQRLHSEAEFEGTGIGLANVKRIIERHGGQIWVEGQPDNGATFYFTLGPSSESS